MVQPFVIDRQAQLPYLESLMNAFNLKNSGSVTRSGTRTLHLRQSMNNASPKVLIVGAGIMGATVAFYLARGGARVTVLEQAEVPAAGVTGRAFGWVGNSNKLPSEDRTLFDLCQKGLAEHERLAGDLPGAVTKVSRGALLWREDP